MDLVRWLRHRTVLAPLRLRQQDLVPVVVVMAAPAAAVFLAAADMAAPAAVGVLLIRSQARNAGE